jgi:hypothetical protein
MEVWRRSDHEEPTAGADASDILESAAHLVRERGIIGVRQQND